MNTPSQNNSDLSDNGLFDEGIDIKRYLSLIISNWYWFAIGLLLSLSLAYGINRWAEKIYTVSSSLLIKDEKFGSTTELSDIFPGNNAFQNQQNLKNEIGILKSFDLNYMVINDLPEFYVNYIQIGRRGIAETRLYKSSPFIVSYDSLDHQIIGQRVEMKIISDTTYILNIEGYQKIDTIIKFKEKFTKAGFNFDIQLRNEKQFKYNPNHSNKFYFQFLSPVTLANYYRSKLLVNPIDQDASLVTLTTSGPVPEQEADYLNKLMDIYLQYGLDLKNKTASQTIEFIDKQLSITADLLKTAEQELMRFRQNYRIINISNEGDLLQRKLEEVDSEKSRLLLQKNYYEYLVKYIESKGQQEDVVAPSIMGVNDQLLINLIAEYTKLQSEKRHLAMNLIQSAGPLTILDTNIEIARQSIKENIINGAANINSSLETIESKLKAIEQEAGKLPATEREMINIQRQFDINNTVYTFLLEKKAEAAIVKASNVPDNRIIDKAGTYNSYLIEPKSRKNTLISIIMGLLVPFILILAIDYLNNKILDKRDIAAITSIPVIGFINHNSSKSELPVSENPGSTLSESFRSIRTSFKYFLKDQKCPVISVSSTITAEGKSFISANLASIIALSGKKVLLVGLDLRKPRIHKIFGLNNDIGMSNYLINEAKYEDIIQKSPIDHLYYTLTGPVPPNPAELIDSEAMREYIKKSKEIFDYIIIDTPPIALVTDALLVSSFTDFYLFVVRQRYSSKNTLELIDELSKKQDIKNVGIVINDIHLSGYYGYGLRYGYSMGYGYTYGYSYYGTYSDRKYGYPNSSGSYYNKENS